LILQAGDLIVDLLEGARRLEHGLRVVARIIDCELRLGRRRDREQAERGSAGEQRMGKTDANHAMISSSWGWGVMRSAATRSAAQPRPRCRSQASAKPS